mmetsp:Transcript_18136/g.32474  ORF Transcript_18136/g.32474 Transcript_18136/m.32474 type:complete len:454 (-) Transcript_18136:132-1493(-)
MALWPVIAGILKPTFGPFGLDVYLEKNEKEAMLTSHAVEIIKRLAVEDRRFNYVLKVIKGSCLNLTSAVLLISVLTQHPAAKLREFYSTQWPNMKAQLIDSAEVRTGRETAEELARTELVGKIAEESADKIIAACFEVAVFDNLKSVKDFIASPLIYILHTADFKCARGLGVRARLELNYPKDLTALLISYKKSHKYGTQPIDPSLLSSFNRAQQARLTSIIEEHAVTVALWYDPVEHWEYDVLSKLRVTLLIHPYRTHFKQLVEYVLHSCTLIDNYYLVVPLASAELVQSNIDTFLFAEVQGSHKASVVIPESPIADVFERIILKVLRVWEAWISCGHRVVSSGGLFELELAMQCREICPELSRSLTELVRALFENAASYMKPKVRWVTFLHGWLQGNKQCIETSFSGDPRSILVFRSRRIESLGQKFQLMEAAITASLFEYSTESLRTEMP